MSVAPKKIFYNFIQFGSCSKGTDPVDPNATNTPIYCLFNFNYTKWSIDRNLGTTVKYLIFTDFWNVCGFDFNQKYVVPISYTNYFTPMTKTMVEYIYKYGFSNHYGYLSTITPLSFIAYDKLATDQFDMILYTDNQIRRLQDFYYEDSSNIYTKYNFNFDLYAQDYNIYNRKLLIFTDVVIRITETSGVIEDSSTYGISNTFRKYFFYYGTDLRKYLLESSVTSILPTGTPQNLSNIDYQATINANKDNKNTSIGYVTLNQAPEYFIISGQFELVNVKFFPYAIGQIDTIKSLTCTISTGSSYGTGFLYKYPNDENKYVITCYHLIQYSDDINYFYASFQIKDPNKVDSTSTTAKFKVIGYDRFSDVLVGLYDPTLSYNIVNKVDMSFYKPSVIDPTLLLRTGEELISVGNIGKDDTITPLYGKIIDDNFSGSFGEVTRPPSILLQIYISKGCSGSPLFLNNITLTGSYNGSYPIVGMMNSFLNDSPQNAIAIQGIMLLNIIFAIVSNYNFINVIYAKDVVKFNNAVKNGFPTVWLGANIEYWYPTSQAKYKQLTNLNYTGGILITDFIIGFDYARKQKVLNPKDLNKHEIFQLFGPLLNTAMYTDFLQNSNVPIVISSISYFDSAYSTYLNRYFGKYSNQIAYSYYLYGNQTIASYVNGPQYKNPVRYEFPIIQIVYYAYDGSVWNRKEISIGGNTADWYVEYTDINGNKFYQHKFEYPLILVDYIADMLDNPDSRTGLSSYTNLSNYMISGRLRDAGDGISRSAGDGISRSAGDGISRSAGDGISRSAGDGIVRGP